jgi:hypothetical protein
MTTNGDMPSRQPEQPNPLHRLFRKLFDLVDDTVERITDDEVEARLRRVLDQAGRSPGSPRHPSPDCLRPRDIEHDDRDQRAPDLSSLGDLTETPDRLRRSRRWVEAVGRMEQQAWAWEIQTRSAIRAVDDARQQAKEIIAEAQEQADAALRRAASMVADARRQAKEIIAEAQEQADPYSASTPPAARAPRWNA